MCLKYFLNFELDVTKPCATLPSAFLPVSRMLPVVQDYRSVDQALRVSCPRVPSRFARRVGTAAILTRTLAGDSRREGISAIDEATAVRRNVLGSVLVYETSIANGAAVRQDCGQSIVSEH